MAVIFCSNSPILLIPLVIESFESSFRHARTLDSSPLTIPRICRVTKRNVLDPAPWWLNTALLFLNIMR